MNQKYNIVKTVKNAIVKIKKDNELKENLKTKIKKTPLWILKSSLKLPIKLIRSRQYKIQSRISRERGF